MFHPTQPAEVVSTAEGRPPRELRDRYGRVFTYLRLAVNNHCQFRCPYCAPQGMPLLNGAHNLTLNEQKRIISLAIRLGVSKIRFTGGEPLLYSPLPELIAWSREHGISQLHVTTNGAAITSRLEELKSAGLTGMNISLDSLKISRLAELTGYRHPERILAGVEAAFAVEGWQVKLNVVLLRGINEDELTDFVELYRQRDWPLRFIELMPFSGSSAWFRTHYLAAEEIYSRLKQLVPEGVVVSGRGTEEFRLQLPGHRHWIGVIPGFSRTFCRQCNRLRITAAGFLKNCLYAGTGTDLRTPLRTGATDKELMDLIAATMKRKPRDGWEAARASISQPQMIQIGG